MERYSLLKQLGDGTFGSVLQAMDSHTGKVVAIKRMKAPSHSWAEVKQLREITALKRVRHPNVVTLFEVIREKMMLYFVFEFLECNLYHVIKDRDKTLPETIVKNYTSQILNGLAYMHEQGYFHRDLKPENILVTGQICKLADFGLAKEVRSKAPMTEYVSTRWYRAPEVLLRDSDYGPSIDIWAMGTIIVELMTLRPIFPGSSEVDQLYKICSILGTPTQATWPKGIQLAAKLNIAFPTFPVVPLQSVVPHASQPAIDVVSGMLMYDCYRRPSARRALAMPWFTIGGDISDVVEPLSSKTPVNIQNFIDTFCSENISSTSSDSTAPANRDDRSGPSVSSDSNEAAYFMSQLDSTPFRPGRVSFERDDGDYDGVYDEYDQLLSAGSDRDGARGSAGGLDNEASRHANDARRGRGGYTVDEEIDRRGSRQQQQQGNYSYSSSRQPYHRDEYDSSRYGYDQSGSGGAGSNPRRAQMKPRQDEFVYTDVEPSPRQNAAYSRGSANNYSSSYDQSSPADDWGQPGRHAGGQMRSSRVEYDAFGRRRY